VTVITSVNEGFDIRGIAVSSLNLNPEFDARVCASGADAPATDAVESLVSVSMASGSTNPTNAKWTR
jgi:hypothetical protein